MSEASAKARADRPVEADPWRAHELPEDEDLRLRVGPLRIRLVRSSGEVWLAHARGEEGPDAAPLGDDAVEWHRWAVPAAVTGVRLVPVFPDRPLVAEPEDTFHLVRGARVRVYVRVPLWVRLELEGTDGSHLTELPSVVLSDTWFGDFMEGELCYFLPTTARRELLPEHFEEHLVVCPLQLSNTSEDELTVEKLALRVPHLTLFRRGRELWADETRVRYQGDEAGSAIRMSHTPPSEASDATLLTPPRTPVERGFRARTFSRLKSLSGFGHVG